MLYFFQQTKHPRNYGFVGYSNDLCSAQTDMNVVKRAVRSNAVYATYIKPASHIWSSLCQSVMDMKVVSPVNF